MLHQLAEEIVEKMCLRGFVVSASNWEATIISFREAKEMLNLISIGYQISGGAFYWNTKIEGLWCGNREYTKVKLTATGSFKAIGRVIFLDDWRYLKRTQRCTEASFA